MGAADAAGLIIVGGTTGSAPFEGRVRVAGIKLIGDPAHGLAHPAVLAAGGRINDELVLIGGTDDPANV